jgi:hypothetical protein
MATVYVLAADGLLYRQPRLEGGDWSLTFAGGDRAELFMRADGRPRHEAAQEAAELLYRLGISVADVGMPRAVKCRHRPDDHGVPSWLWRFRVKAPVPSGLMCGLEGVRQPPRSGLVCSFGSLWG